MNEKKSWVFAYNNKKQQLLKKILKALKIKLSVIYAPKKTFICVFFSLKIFKLITETQQ